MRSGSWMLLSVVLLAACKDTLTVPPEQKFSIVEMDGTAGANPGTYQMTTAATVFVATGTVQLPSGGAGNDQCAVVDYAPGSGGPGALNFLNPGFPFTVAVADTMDTLAASFSQNGGTQWIGGPLAYVPGDSVTINMPGFPGDTGIEAVSLKTRTSELFDFSGVVIPSSPNSSMNVSWTNPPADQNSTMIVSLRYNSTTNGPLDKQVYCAFVDDGQGTIFALNLSGWRTATDHEAVFTRLRTDAKRNNISLLYTISTYAVTKAI